MSVEDEDALDDSFDEFAEESDGWMENDRPFVDGARRGEVINYDGVAARVVADDGKRWMTVVMVGDDAQYRVDRDDYPEIKREDYCGECGQMGCTHDGVEREE